MSADIVHIRDFKRREENEAALARVAKAILENVDTAPSEMPPVQPYFAPEKDPA